MTAAAALLALAVITAAPRHATTKPEAAATPATAAANNDARDPAADPDAAEEGEAADEGGEAADNAEEAGTAAAEAPGGEQAGDETPPATPLDHLGHLHSVVIHAAVGWLLLVFLFELAGLVLHLEDPHHLRLWALRLTVGAVVASALTGLARLASLGNEGADVAAAVVHRNVELVAGSLLVIAWVLREAHGRTGKRGLLVAAVIVLACSTAIAAFGAHLGGVFAHGEL